MKILNQIKPALISYWMIKTFKAFYPNITIAPTVDAPNSWKALKQFKGRNVLPVFNGACDSSIYNNPNDNIIFRAWHDCVHLENNLSFSSQDEKKVGLIQCNQLRLMGAPVHVINAIFFDVVGQVEYYALMGEFVVNQREFVQSCLDVGLTHTITKYNNPLALDC
jgi:hypothetical protein